MGFASALVVPKTPRHVQVQGSFLQISTIKMENQLWNLHISFAQMVWQSRGQKPVADPALQNKSQFAMYTDTVHMANMWPHVNGHVFDEC
jgi:hypothetical protein